MTSEIPGVLFDDSQTAFIDRFFDPAQAVCVCPAFPSDEKSDIAASSGVSWRFGARWIPLLTVSTSFICSAISLSSSNFRHAGKNLDCKEATHLLYASTTPPIFF